jgi:3-oxoacyl-[acyl-carrier-protein] synthase-3
MRTARLEGVAVRGLRCAVPKAVRTLAQDGIIADDADRIKLETTIGVSSRRIANPELCTSDLCQKAAEGLITQLGWEKDTIDVLLFVSQSADYVIPSTACALQARLGLAQGLAFDINLGCSGYAYGLWTAASLLKTLIPQGRPARALVLAGDVSTSKLMPGDRGTVPLFGDAGSATALEIDPSAPPLTGVFGTDGTGAEHLIIRAGALREPLVPPVTPHSLEKAAELFDHARLHLNGAEVFNFTLRIVPALANALLDASGQTVDSLDHVIMHQANAMMLTHLRKKLKIPPEKAPIALEGFGNTSSASIPLAICSTLPHAFETPKSTVFMGFGVGWSWSALHLTLGPIPSPHIDEI